MKYLIIAGLIYMIYKYNTLKSLMGSAQQKEDAKINPEDPIEGEYVDYEEVD